MLLIVVGLSGISDLPLHHGHVPPWLFRRMVRLSGLIMELLLEEHGVRRTIKLLSNPIFFQSLNNLIGMDWDSSGSTTVTLAALKEALRNSEEVRVLGGKGRSSLMVPKELEELGKVWDIDIDSLITSSRLAAKIDTVALQDGYSLYHHSMILGNDGTWCVIQQGMNEEKRLARRYHIWMGNDLLNGPHSGILGVKGDRALNMVSTVSSNARKLIIDLIRQGTSKVVKDWYSLRARDHSSILTYLGVPYYNPYVALPRVASINEEALIRAKHVNDFRDLLLVKGMGPNTMLALALIAELVYGEHIDWEDPANIDPRRFTFAFGGKDGSPFPIDREVYDAVIDILQSLADRLRRYSDSSTYLRYLARAARRLNLPVNLVRPTPP